MTVRYDRPETWLAIHGFLVAFVWEMFQMPFFEMGDLSVRQVTMNCALASFGDAGIMVAAYLAASWFAGDRRWLARPGWASLAAYLANGQAITIAVEILAVRVPWGWSYSSLMPRIMGVGLVPVVMWIVVPLIALGLTSRSVGPSAG